MSAARLDLPADLTDLRCRYGRLPPKGVRWTTDVGRDFLNRVETATNDYPVRIVAEALGTTHQAIYAMRWRIRHEHTGAWPTDDQMRDLRAAWRIVEALHLRKQQVRRNSRAFEDVHVALLALQQQFPYRVIARALALDGRSRALRRFLDPPLNSRAELEELATLINLYQQLPRRFRLGRTVITMEFTLALRRATHSVSILKIARALDMEASAIEHILAESDRIIS